MAQKLPRAIYTEMLALCCSVPVWFRLLYDLIDVLHGIMSSLVWHMCIECIVHGPIYCGAGYTTVPSRGGINY